MAFVARQMQLANGFCKHDATQTTSFKEGSPIVCPAGVVVTITGNDGEVAVVKKITACTQEPFGFLMNEIINQYDRYYVPWGAKLPRDVLREFVGSPVTVVHGGLWSTTVYDNDTQITAGAKLYATASGTLCVSTGAGMCASGTALYNTPVAIAMNTLTTTRLAQGRQLHFKALI